MCFSDIRLLLFFGRPALLQHFEFHPSRYLTLLLLVAHSAVLAVLPLIALPLWAKSILVILLLYSLLHYLRRDAWLRLSDSYVGLALEGDGFILRRRDGVSMPCAILSDSLVTPYLTVLNVLPQGAHFARSVLILPDSLDAEAFRQLRVWLKWGDQPAS